MYRGEAYPFINIGKSYGKVIKVGVSYAFAKRPLIKKD